MHAEVALPIAIGMVEHLDVINLVLANHAEVAHLVEHNLAKVGVAGSSPVFRSNPAIAGFFFGIG
jgi:hypothetical protein